MLTRFVRVQLTIFATLSIIGVIVMAVVYMQLPTVLGLGRMAVMVELPNSGGLYRFANVTYRGVQVGKVTAIDLTDGIDTHTQAILTLDSSTKIPANLEAEVRSISAIGEQYVDLVPRTDAPPYLHDGSVIAMRDTSVPQAVGPVLDQVSALLTSIPKDKLNALLNETSKGFRGAGYDFGSFVDSSSTLSHDFNDVAGRLQTLINNSAPLLDSQADTQQSIRTWTRSLAGITDQLAQNDAQLRTLLQRGPEAANEVSRLLNQIKPTLPILLANLTTIGQIGITYNPSIEQVLILLPPFVSSIQAALPRNNATGIPTGGEFAATVGDPNPCTVGFLPPSQWRSPADTTAIDTPDGLYCKLPQDSPSTVRGARNYPCMGHPGKRAPTVQICDSDKPFEPLAMRQHILGPNPIDPNLLSQGIPPDQRTNLGGDNIFGPPRGTSPPPMPAAPQPPLPALPEPPMPLDMPDPDQPVPKTAPSVLHTNAAGGPSVGFTVYNPRTGNYFGPDGKLYNQTDLPNKTNKSWKDLLLH
ncbi:ABC-type transporter Mla maintaining outer membrane lipid asymmetry, periplasmic component MlaD [Mycobacterium numidiamassiliense]|uniref:ABC-type transporter Mla maintaining outer membrane lipid asymmetry, periplasmic component MlaD n=1 Tax=Mycobacterium numidiamassiliense TaxID=1841861 RepID=A0A2U3P308_9MYCO|nr:MlaD family protein [Mycobacterium numidiamassiliense]SPM38130.1 ABC-type transporter Mla maintaining outer membrane lipid asymmetry, periplasmic component MlaD [Mycobacterium numidiamassiliense]